MLHLHSRATSHSPACMHISFYSPTKFGRCIILLFSLYRLRKLRPRETKRLTQWYSFHVFFPQTHRPPSSLPPFHANLCITNEHLVDLQPKPIHPFPALSRHTHQQVGHTLKYHTPGSCSKEAGATTSHFGLVVSPR